MTGNDDRTPSARLIGRHLVSIDRQAGTAELTFEAVDSFLNRHGTVQGGLLAAMLDSAAGITLVSTLPAGLTAVTTRLDTRFHAPAAPGTISATATVLGCTDRDAEVEARLFDHTGREVASARVEMRLRRKPASTTVAPPPGKT